MDMQSNNKRRSAKSRGKVHATVNLASTQRSSANHTPIKWEMSALEALEVNYLTRVNRSINTL